MVSGPASSQVHTTDGVLVLKTNAVRMILVGDVRQAEVTHRPTTENGAHAVIHLLPAADNDSQFKKLREHLKRIAQWQIHPTGTCE